MSVTRRATDKDATWTRAWTVDTAAELPDIPEPRRGDVAFATDTGLFYFWFDDDTWRALPVYEEGVWTPTVEGQGGTPGTFNYSQQHGRYTRIGNKVFADYRMVVTSTSVSPTGDIDIGGIPFPVGGGVQTNPSFPIGFYQGVTLAAGYTDIAPVAKNGFTTLEIYKTGSGKPLVQLQGSELGSAFTLVGTVAYHA